MDRNCKQKLAGILAGTAMVLFLAVAVLFLVRENDEISQRQMEEIIMFYPKAGQEIKETFSYYDRVRKGEILGIFVFAFIFCGALFWIVVKKREAAYKKACEQNLFLLSYKLEQFQKGNFKVEEEFVLDNFNRKEKEHWEHLQEKLNELGVCIFSIKEKFWQEENSTKSLITDISHQLKTPLAAIRMNYEMIQEESLTKEEREEFFQREKQEIDKLESLLEELMKLSRLEGHMIRLNRQKEELRSLLLTAMNEIFMKARQKDMELQAEIPKDIWIYADAKWTVESFVNVLDNGIKYSPTHTKISIQAKKLGNLAVIEIEDEGMGIPPEELHKIFHRFYRGRKAASLVKEGAGVGLYLTRKILEEQGGAIVAKRKQAGTVFRITMPLY